jgi:hypothetical protein
MSAAEQLQQLAAEVAKHRGIVDKECSGMAEGMALMKKWEERRLVDAITREAKARALVALGYN